MLIVQALCIGVQISESDMLRFPYVGEGHSRHLECGPLPAQLAPREAGHPVPSNTCCSSVNASAAIPMGYDKDKCQAVFNKETCTYTVLEKKDPLKNCTVTAWVL